MVEITQHYQSEMFQKSPVLATIAKLLRNLLNCFVAFCDKGAGGVISFLFQSTNATIFCRFLSWRCPFYCTFKKFGRNYHLKCEMFQKMTVLASIAKFFENIFQTVRPRTAPLSQRNFAKFFCDKGAGGVSTICFHFLFFIILMFLERKKSSCFYTYVFL